MSASPGAMFFVECHHITGAHRAAISFPACSKSNASQRCLRKGTVVLGELEMRFRFQRFIVRAQPQIVSRQVCINDSVRGLFIVVLSRCLILAESLLQLCTIPIWKQCSPSCVFNTRDLK